MIEDAVTAGVIVVNTNLAKRTTVSKRRIPWKTLIGDLALAQSAVNFAVQQGIRFAKIKTAVTLDVAVLIKFKGKEL
jgi:hypothetical protein